MIYMIFQAKYTSYYAIYMSVHEMPTPFKGTVDIAYLAGPIFVLHVKLPFISKRCLPFKVQML